MMMNGLRADRWRGQHFSNIGCDYFEVNEYARDCILGAAGSGSIKLLTAKIAKRNPTSREGKWGWLAPEPGAARLAPRARCLTMASISFRTSLRPCRLSLPISWRTSSAWRRRRRGSWRERKGCSPTSGTALWDRRRGNREGPSTWLLRQLP